MQKYDKRYIVACTNCGTGASYSWICGLTSLGFSLHHIACRECGQYALMHRDDIERRQLEVEQHNEFMKQFNN